MKKCMNEKMIPKKVFNFEYFLKKATFKKVVFDRYENIDKLIFDF